MVLKRIVILLGVAFLGSCNESPTTSTNEHSARYMTKGELIFVERCTVCHGENGDAGIAGAKDLTVSSLEGEELKNVILYGKNAMPAFKMMLEEESEVDSLIVYLNTLK